MSKIFRLIKRISKDSKDSENYHSGLVGEHIIVSAYKQMSLDKLIKLRFVLNKIIKKKKEHIRVKNAKFTG